MILMRVGDVLLKSLSFESSEALGVVDGGIDAVFDASRFFSFLGIVPAV